MNVVSTSSRRALWLGTGALIAALAMLAALGLSGGGTQPARADTGTMSLTAPVNQQAEKRLELAVFRGLGFELLELVGEVGALTPDLLEAVGDLGEEPVDAGSLVAAEPRSAELYVSDLYWCKRQCDLLRVTGAPRSAD